MSRTCRRTMVFLSGVALIAAFGARAGALPPQAGLLPQTDAHDPSKLDFQSALSHYNAGDYSRAAQELEALARQAPESFDVGETFAGVDYETALDAVEELRSLVPPEMTMAQMALRWTAAAMLEAKKGFRKLKAHKQLPILRMALKLHDERLSNKSNNQALAHQAKAA